MIEFVPFIVVTLAVIYVQTESAVFVFGRLLQRDIALKLGPLAPMLLQLMYCPACFGFWVGLGNTVLWPLDDQTLFERAFEAACAGMVLGRLWLQFVAKDAISVTFRVEMSSDARTRDMFFGEGDHEPTEEG